MAAPSPPHAGRSGAILVSSSSAAAPLEETRKPTATTRALPPPSSLPSGRAAGGAPSPVCGTATRLASPDGGAPSSSSVAVAPPEETREEEGPRSPRPEEPQVRPGAAAGNVKVRLCWADEEEEQADWPEAHASLPSSPLRRDDRHEGEREEDASLTTFPPPTPTARPVEGAARYAARYAVATGEALSPPRRVQDRRTRHLPPGFDYWGFQCAGDGRFLWGQFGVWGGRGPAGGLYTVFDHATAVEATPAQLRAQQQRL